MKEKNKLLYLVSGDRKAGICSYVMQVIHMGDYCDRYNIPMFVDFSQHMLYQKYMNSKDNVWEYWFDQPCMEMVNMDSYNVEEAVWFHHEDPRALRFEFRFDKNSNYLKRARELCNKYIKIKQHIKNRANNFIQNNLSDNYISIHKRGTDHDNVPFIGNINFYFNKVDSVIDNYNQLLVCSDELFTVNRFIERYGQKVVYYGTAKEEKQTTTGTHFRNDTLDNEIRYAYQNGEDCIIEAILMSKSKKILKTVSNVSHFAVMLNSVDFEFIDNDMNCKY